MKGQLVEVVVACKVCENCKTPLLDVQKMNILRRTVADKYRELKQFKCDEVCTEKVTGKGGVPEEGVEM